MIRGSLLRATAAVVLFGSVLFPADARSSLRVVPDQFPTIQSALTAAISGDSVMVRAGTYTEALSLSGKDVTLFGEADSGSTVVTTGGTARILDIGSGVTAATLISELMFRSGLSGRGGAIRCSGGASPIFRGCEFVSNVARGDDTCSYGGAMFLDAGSLAVVEDCLFLDNLADATWGPTQFWDGSGGALCVWSGARVEVRRTRFESNLAGGFEGGWGGAVILMAATASFEDCVFTGNWAGGGGAILARSGLTVTRCTFAGNNPGAIACGHTVQLCSPPGTSALSSRIEGCVFRDQDTSFGVGATVAMEGGATILANTFAFNRITALSVSPQVLVQNNIVANNTGIGITCVGSHAAGAITCNDVWANGGGNYGGDCSDLTGTDDNLSLDPLFCDVGAARDLRVHAESPCAEENSICGAIGALRTGCELADVSAGPEPRAGILLAPAPTPAAGPMTIGFILAQPSRVRLEVYDPAGRRIAILEDRWFAAGPHESTWSGTDERGGRRSGVYFVVMRLGGAWHTRRAVLIP